MADTPETTVDNLFTLGKLVRAAAPPAEAAEGADAAKAEAAKKLYDRQRLAAAQMIVEYCDAIDMLAAAEPPPADPTTGPKPVELSGQLTRAIDLMDEVLGHELNAVMLHDDFKTLEASWRGLAYLVFNTETSTRLKLRLLTVTKEELRDDLEKAIDKDQSVLFKKVYEEEYGTYGGSPYGLLVADYFFDNTPADIDMLTMLSGVAAAAHAPLLAAPNPSLFDIEDYTELPNPRDLAKKFDSLEHIKWRNFRDTEDSRYVSLVLPRYLVRQPWGPESKGKRPADGMVYEEAVDGSDHDRYLWGNSAYLLAQRVTNAFALYSWTAAIRGVEGGGMVEDMPVHIFTTEDGDQLLKCPTETSITDRREKELNDLGFIALVHKKADNKAVFFGSHTANKPKTYFSDFANANAGLSATLSYLLCASRFAHYIKSIMRDKVGSFMTAGQVSEYLNGWIVNYVLLDDSAPQVMKAKYPLRDARVDVTEVPGKAGSYKATVFLRPHFQLEELTTSIRLVAELPPPAA